jgi:hypothetical protein
MPTRPRSGSAFDVRQRKSWSSFSDEGFLNETTWTPCGLTPFITCSIAESLPAASHRLQDDEHRVAIACPEQLLRVRELSDAPLERLLRVLLQLVVGEVREILAAGPAGVPAREARGLARLDPELLEESRSDVGGVRLL